MENLIEYAMALAEVKASGQDSAIIETHDGYIDIINLMSITHEIKKKRYPGMPYQNQNVRIKIVSTGSPLNILVKLRNKTLVVVPFGNLCERNKYK